MDVDNEAYERDLEYLLDLLITYERWYPEALAPKILDAGFYRKEG